MRYSHRIQVILNLQLPLCRRLLDIGCGSGEYATAMSSRFGVTELYGIDMGEDAIRMAHGRGINAVNHDLNNTPYPFDDNEFNLVYAGEIIEHLLSPDSLLEEIWRVLKSDGYCIISTPNIASWSSRLLLLFGWQPYNIPIPSKVRGAGAFMSKARSTVIRTPRNISTTGGVVSNHIQFFTCNAFVDLIAAHGFRVEKVIGSPADEFTFPMNRALRRLITGLDKWVSILSTSLASDVTVVAVKGDKNIAEGEVYT